MLGTLKFCSSREGRWEYVESSKLGTLKFLFPGKEGGSM